MEGEEGLQLLQGPPARVDDVHPRDVVLLDELAGPADRDVVLLDDIRGRVRDHIDPDHRRAKPPHPT